jgi:DNA repair protein RadA/Sms
MAKETTRFVCGGCQAIHVKWIGRCTTCNAWGSLVEEAAPKKKASPGREKPSARPVGDVEAEALPRVPTGIGELDRVLGGGAVPGGVVLVGGDPGVGKSTLLLQALGQIAARGKTALYVSGEESASQTALRARRLGIDEKRLLVMAASELDDVESETRRTKPAAVVIDSVQTVRESGLGTPAGTITQLREVTARVCEMAQREDVAVFLVGHVTKDGALAGPKVLEHLVDAVLAFEGERGHAFRALRVTKNRFGSATEVGLFEMTPEGMREVTRPSELFLSERPSHASGSVVGATSEGARSLLVEVQALVGPPGAGTPRRTANGVDPARLAMLLAVLARRAGVEAGSCDVFVNLAGGLRVDEPALDLAVALSVASSYRDRVFSAETIAFGEIGLAGEVRGVPRVGPRLAEARAMGFRRALIPASSAERLSAGEREGLEIVAVRTLEQAADELGLSAPNARLPLCRRKLCAEVGTRATEVTSVRSGDLAWGDGALASSSGLEPLTSLRMAGRTRADARRGAARRRGRAAARVRHRVGRGFPRACERGARAREEP